MVPLSASLLLLGAAVAQALATPVLSSGPCAPSLVLDGVSESEPNTPNQAFGVKPSCGALNTTDYAVFLQGTPSAGPFASLGQFVNETSITPGGISIDQGFGAGNQSFLVVAVSDGGKPLLQQFSVQFETLTSRNPSFGAPGALLAREEQFVCSGQCGSCSTCPENPVCQPDCQSPPQSCAFYQSCAEAAMQCGPDGYPVRYGDKNCNAFVSNLSHFTAQGQAWIWAVMHCLQLALLDPITACGATCQSVYDAAFASHPQCYLASGVCDLPLEDWAWIVITVNTDLFAGPALQQILSTVKGCAEHYVSEIEQTIDQLKQMALDDILDAPLYLAK